VNREQLQFTVDWLKESLGLGHVRARAEFKRFASDPLLVKSGSTYMWRGGHVIEISPDLRGRRLIEVLAHELAHVRQHHVGAACLQTRVRPTASYQRYRQSPVEVEARCVSAVLSQALFDGPLPDYNQL
jgi:hypothetical protein